MGKVIWFLILAAVLFVFTVFLLVDINSLYASLQKMEAADFQIEKIIGEVILVSVFLMFFVCAGVIFYLRNDWQKKMILANQRLAKQLDELHVLEKSRVAALNLMEDAESERERAVAAKEELLRSQQALRESEERTRLIIETANDAFVAIDDQGAVIDWNRQAEVIFGWTKQEILGSQLVNTIIPNKYKEGHQKGFKHFFATGEGPVLRKRIELSALNRKGGEFPIEITIWPVRTGNTFRFNSFIHDISERKQAEEELKKAHFQLKEAEKAEMLVHLAAGAAHEVKNPLAILTQGIDYISLHNKSNGTVSSVLKDMGEAVNRADNIIRSLLDLSAPTQLTLSLEDLNALIDDSLHLVKQNFDKKHVKVLKEIESSLPQIQIDKTKLLEVLINIFNNAVDAMRSGGTLSINAHKAKRENEVILEIEDTGIGIPKEILAKIFEPFVTTKRAKGGTGLGLSIARTMIQLHGGSISVENKSEGPGARFVITLPINQN